MRPLATVDDLPAARHHLAHTAARVAAVACAVGLLLGACAPAGTPTPSVGGASAAASPSASAAPSQAPASASATASPTPHLAGPVDHVFLIVDENHGYDQIVGAAAAAYINQLIAGGALSTNYQAVAHPSLPNYLALIGGSTFGITSDCQPTQAGCHTGRVSLPDRIEAAGLSWRGYFDDMPAPCARSDASDYRVHHDPFLYFDAISGDQARCEAHVLPLSALATDLSDPARTPTFALIVPGNRHNMHDGSIAAGDRWLRENIAPILASPAWQGGRSLLVLTFDEDDGSALNRVVTVFYGPPARAGYRSGTGYTHYSLLRTIEDWLGAAPMTANDRLARPMTDLMR